VEQAVGKELLHDMTQIIPGESKTAAFLHGQRVSVGDLCRLQQMGRQHVYTQDEMPSQSEWVHENDAAIAFAKAMAGKVLNVREHPMKEKSRWLPPEKASLSPKWSDWSNSTRCRASCVPV